MIIKMIIQAKISPAKGGEVRDGNSAREGTCRIYWLDYTRKGVATINSLLSLTWKTEEAHLEELAVRME